MKRRRPNGQRSTGTQSPGICTRSCATNVKTIPELPAICEQGLQPPNVALKVLRLKSIASCRALDKPGLTLVGPIQRKRRRSTA